MKDVKKEDDCHQYKILKKRDDRTNQTIQKEEVKYGTE